MILYWILYYCECQFLNKTQCQVLKGCNKKLPVIFKLSLVYLSEASFFTFSESSYGLPCGPEGNKEFCGLCLIPPSPVFFFFSNLCVIGCLSLCDVSDQSHPLFNGSRASICGAAFLLLLLGLCCIQRVVQFL